jgi:KDO2-lipid IV(A) palmitoleoyltransferase
LLSAVQCRRARKLIAENFKSIGMALLETGMAWFWPDERVRKWFDVEGLDNLKRAQMQKRGVMVVGVHFMSLELGGRVMGLCQPMMATYRPHNSPLMEWVQTRGRMRSNKAMISRNNLRGMVGALKKGEAVWFAPIRIMDVKAAALRLSLRLKMLRRPTAPLSFLVCQALPC